MKGGFRLDAILNFFLNQPLGEGLPIILMKIQIHQKISQGGREREQGDRHLGVQLSAHNWAPLHQHGWQQNFNNMVVNGELLSELFNSFERI